jgi:hypothetical protein
MTNNTIKNNWGANVPMVRVYYTIYDHNLLEIICKKDKQYHNEPPAEPNVTRLRCPNADTSVTK